MLKKIDIQSFGLFREYNWDCNIGIEQNATFKDINIIYGRNYSGKTTLSRIFRYIETGNIHERYSTCKFLLTDNNNKTVSEKDIPFPNKIRVFNSDFVKFNLSWLYDNEKGEIKPFTLLGSENIEATKRIEEINILLGNTETNEGLYYEYFKNNELFSSISKNIKEKTDNLDERLSDHANKKIKVNTNYLRQGTPYNITNLKKEIEEIKHNIPEHILNDNLIKNRTSIIEEPEKSTITIQSIDNPDFNNLYLSTKNLIEKNITLTKTLNELLSNAFLQKWIDDGRKLHNENTKICAFCHGDLLPERLEEINSHFSKESEELKLLEQLKNKYSNYFISNSIKKDDFYISFQNDFIELQSKWNNAIKEFSDYISELSALLDMRFNDIFNPKTIDNIIIPDIDFLGIIYSLSQLINQHNEKKETLEDDKQKSRKLLRYSLISNFLLDIRYNDLLIEIEEEVNKQAIQKHSIDDMSIKISTLEEEKRQTSLRLNDEGKAAEKISSHLSTFFGNSSLTLKPEKIDTETPKTNFIIMRGNEKAYNLSEGECSLISFCYFIAKLEDELNSNGQQNLIIYIDDPISSLDNNHIFFMFSLIDTIIVKQKKYLQLFISTHNLDFLKYIQRFSVKDKDKEKTINHYFVEKQKKDTEYRCFLKPMPFHLKNYITEYNYLFHEIYKMATYSSSDKIKNIEENFTLFYNLPNIMRRFLECYLYYRFPNTKKPLDNLDKIFGANIPSMVNRVLNEYSHLNWGDRGTLAADVIEAETVAKYIIDTIKNNDDKHYEALCSSISEIPLHQ